MYQIPFSCGHEIQVIGPGDNGLCRVYKGHIQVFGGKYAECVKWLNDRGMTEIAGQTAAGIAEQQGR